MPYVSRSSSTDADVVAQRCSNSFNVCPKNLSQIRTEN